KNIACRTRPARAISVIQPTREGNHMRLFFAIAFLALALPTVDLASAADTQVPGVQRSSDVSRTAPGVPSPSCARSKDVDACCQAGCDSTDLNKCVCNCTGGIWHRGTGRRAPSCTFK